jgi:hypothetical protein
MSIEDRAKAVNDLVNQGFLSVKDCAKLLDFPDIMPTSVHVWPGLYLLSWVGNQIILTTTTYSTGELMRNGNYDWVQINTSGYFKGTSMLDVQFIASTTAEDKLNYSRMMYNLSQEEIDQLMAEMLKYGQKPEPDEQLDFFGSGIPSSKGYVDQDQTKKKQCEHEFVPYHGLKETFDYCKKCDAKK